MASKQRFAAVILALVVFPISAWADLEDGLAAFSAGDYRAAFDEWIPLAHSGNPEAQYRLGLMYERSLGVDLDMEQSVRWYLAAAEQGQPRAQNNLGVLYETGRGVPVDLEQALAWYRKAAEQGRLPAQFNVARMLDEGLGTNSDQTEALVWYRKAAARGHANAQTRLGEMFEQGVGTEVDDGEAAKWYRRAAKQDVPLAQLRLAQMYQDGRGVPKDSKKADKWRREAASHGAGLEPSPTVPASDVASAPVASAPSSGSPEGMVESIDPEGEYRAGVAYMTGDGAERDPVLAEEAFVRAALRGHQMAAYRVGLLYMRGDGASGRKEFVKAHAWFAVLADQGYGDAAQWRDRLVKKMSDEELAASVELQSLFNPQN
jgi:TPR repeat protein